MPDRIETMCMSHGPVDSGAHFAAGDVFGEWRLTAFIGRGGSGEVYCARHVRLGIPVALKVLMRDDGRAKARFAREARLLAEMRSMSFPRFFAYGEANGRAYLALELLEPCELPGEDKEVAKFLLRVCDGVAEMYAMGIVHRDIKPGNILWRRGESGAATPVIADLGLAKEVSAPADGRADSITLVDGRRAGVGTPGYGAPEQMERGEATVASDVHALGVLADRCFGGNPSGRWRRIVQRATSSIPSHRYSGVQARDTAAQRVAVAWRGRRSRVRGGGGNVGGPCDASIQVLRGGPFRRTRRRGVSRDVSEDGAARLDKGARLERRIQDLQARSAQNGAGAVPDGSRRRFRRVAQSVHRIRQAVLHRRPRGHAEAVRARHGQESVAEQRCDASSGECLVVGCPRLVEIVQLAKQQRRERRHLPRPAARENRASFRSSFGGAVGVCLPGGNHKRVQQRGQC